MIDHAGTREREREGVGEAGTGRGGFRKCGNSLEGFHAEARQRATAQSIELSISRLVGPSDKVTHPTFAASTFCFAYHPCPLAPVRPS